MREGGRRRRARLHRPRRSQQPAKARLKYVLDRMGREAFLAEVEKEYGAPLRRAGAIALAPRPVADKHGHIGVHPQRQAGLSYLGVVLPVGRITSGQMRGLAEISERFGSGTLRLTVWQNLLISDVADAMSASASPPLQALGIGVEASAIRRGLVACTGNAGCKFAASNTKGHACGLPTISEARVAVDLPINIHLTGCHHSCAQHYVGDIGLLACKVERGEQRRGLPRLYRRRRASTAEQAMAREYARDVVFDELPAMLERLLRSWLSIAPARRELFRILPPPRRRGPARTRRARADSRARRMTVRTTCPYCGVGCGIVAMPDGKGGADIAGDPQHPANRGRLCSKGAALGETLSLEDRLLHPEIDGQRVSWETALDTVADGFRGIIDKHGPDAVAFYVSGQLLTEDYYVANKLIKGFLGTANIDTNSRLCMASSVAGHKRAFGSDTVPGLYEDFELADLVVLVGSNLAWCHPVLFQRLEAAKRCRPAMKIVVIDPRRTETCGIADLHLALKPGSDVALFNALLLALQRRGVVATDFVDAHQRPRRAWPWRRQRHRRLRSAGRDVATFFDWFARTEKDRHALFAGRQSIERRRRQGQCADQLPSADRPHRPARHGAVLDHRPAQRDGRPRGRRARQHARRAHGLCAGRRRSGAPLLEGAAHRHQARPEGGRVVRRRRARRDQGGLGHGDQSGRQPAECGCCAGCAEELRIRDRLRSDPRQRHGRRLSHPASRACLGGEGRHRHELRARRLAPAAVPARTRRGASGLVDPEPGCGAAWLR
jgi:hypothetical protein